MELRSIQNTPLKNGISIKISEELVIFYCFYDIQFQLQN